MEISQYNAELVRKLQRLPNELRQYMVARIGNDATAAIKRRVIHSGIAADGTPFTPYSTKPTLAGASSFLNKAGFNAIAGTPEQRKKLKWVKVKGHNLFVVPGGYKQIRELGGQKNPHKSFLFRKFMWDSVKVRNSQVTNLGADVTIGPEPGKETKKMQGHVDRENKPLLDLSRAEIAAIDRTLEIWINNYFK